ncbi:hypothetical protein E6H19_07090 [Candidatus Bathyarchaeota archaeon]|nr:MAG: hypothetical protein E6H19_07090 [Candidatus Bathyarchaeota archaeon]
MNLSRLVSPPPCLQKLEEGLRGLKGSELDAINYRVNPITAIMERYKIPLVNGSGRTIGYGDRWWAHRVRDGPDGLILGEKHVGITIACVDDDGRILVQLRKHRIFNKVWSLSGDTHPRKYDTRKVETLSEAARRCAKEDLGVVIKRWGKTVSLSYSARDPRDPRYCENELLHVLATKHGGLSI